MKNKVTNDMTKGKPSLVLIKFAIPIILSGIFQQLYSMMDSIVVGKFDGVNALAAVGSSYPITVLFISIATGAGIGCSVVVAQIFGRNELDKVKVAVSTAMISIVVLAMITMIISVFLCDNIITLLGTPEEIYESASTYLRIYTYGIFFLFLYNITTSIFNGLGDSKTPLYFLIFSSCLNIILDIVFVRNLQMSVAGVGWATFIAQGTASCLAFITLMIRLSKIKIESKIKHFDGGILKEMIKVALPSILQFSTVAIGQLMVQALVNGFGAVVIAGYAAAVKIDSFFRVPLQSIGTAVSSFSAQNYGAKEEKRIKMGYKSAMGIALAYSVVAIVIVYIFGDVLIGLFDDGNSGDGVISVGMSFMKVVAPGYLVFVALMIGNGVLRGTSNMKGFIIDTTVDLATRVGLSYLLVARFGYQAIWWAIPTGWLLGSCVAVYYYKKIKYE